MSVMTSSNLQLPDADFIYVSYMYHICLCIICIIYVSYVSYLCHFTRCYENAALTNKDLCRKFPAFLISN